MSLEEFFNASMEVEGCDYLLSGESVLTTPYNLAERNVRLVLVSQ